MDKLTTSVEIERLAVRARHGVFDQERKVGNDFEVTVRVDYPWDIDSDSLDGTLNYGEPRGACERGDGKAVGSA